MCWATCDSDANLLLRVIIRNFQCNNITQYYDKMNNSRPVESGQRMIWNSLYSSSNYPLIILPFHMVKQHSQGHRYEREKTFPQIVKSRCDTVLFAIPPLSGYSYNRWCQHRRSWLKMSATGCTTTPTLNRDQLMVLSLFISIRTHYSICRSTSEQRVFIMFWINFTCPIKMKTTTPDTDDVFESK